MSTVWGSKIKIAVFGESHSDAIGVVIDNLPPGIELDMAEIERQMARRAPNGGDFSTPRVESDKVEIVSGYFNDRTTGTLRNHPKYQYSFVGLRPAQRGRSSGAQRLRILPQERRKQRLQRRRTFVGQTDCAAGICRRDMQAAFERKRHIRGRSHLFDRRDKR